MRTLRLPCLDTGNPHSEYAYGYPNDAGKTTSFQHHRLQHSDGAQTLPAFAFEHQKAAHHICCGMVGRNTIKAGIQLCFRINDLNLHLFRVDFQYIFLTLFGNLAPQRLGFGLPV